MGPFPHDAPAATISADNPMGTDGFEFVEYAHPKPEELHALFKLMGYAPVARHKTKKITVYRQGDINYLVNEEPAPTASASSPRTGPARRRWRSAWSMRSRPMSARSRSARSPRISSAQKTLDVPAIKGIGGSLLYFVDRYGAKGSAYDSSSNGWARRSAPAGAGLYYIDHLTHNVHRGRMDVWTGFYAKLFNFRQIRFFDIEGRASGLFSRALTSPDGKIRIPINEDAGDSGRSRNISTSIAARASSTSPAARGTSTHRRDAARGGLPFMPSPPDTYFEKIDARLPSTARTSPLQRERHSDRRRGVVDGGQTKCCCRYSRQCDRADLLRIHPAQGRRRIRRRQFQGAVRIDRGRPDRRGVLKVEPSRRLSQLIRPGRRPGHKHRCGLFRFAGATANLTTEIMGPALTTAFISSTKFASWPNNRLLRPRIATACARSRAGAGCVTAVDARQLPCAPAKCGWFGAFRHGAGSARSRCRCLP
jgi:4-hydroxyphenylpyruvate dioxygenase